MPTWMSYSFDCAGGPRRRCVTMFFPGAELVPGGVANHVVMEDQALPTEGWWGQTPGDRADLEAKEGGGWGWDVCHGNWAAAVGGTGIATAPLMGDSAARGNGAAAASDSDDDDDIDGTMPSAPHSTASIHSSDNASSSSTGDGCSSESSCSVSSTDSTTVSYAQGGKRGPQPRTYLVRRRPPQRSTHYPSSRKPAASAGDRPRTSVIDFSGFAASLSTNVSGVFRHIMAGALRTTAFVGETTQYGAEGVFPAIAVMRLNGRATREGAWGGGWSPAGGSAYAAAAAAAAAAAVPDAAALSLGRLETAFAALAIGATPLVRGPWAAVAPLPSTPPPAIAGVAAEMEAGCPHVIATSTPAATAMVAAAAGAAAAADVTLPADTPLPCTVAPSDCFSITTEGGTSTRRRRRPRHDGRHVAHSDEAASAVDGQPSPATVSAFVALFTEVGD
ncbi:hypothetical protein MMPV_003786 [Pyropia vietnamensis]